MSKLPTRIRKFQAGDFEALLQIDQICFPADIAFSRGELVFCLRHPKSIAWIAEGRWRNPWLRDSARGEPVQRAYPHIGCYSGGPATKHRNIADE